MTAPWGGLARCVGLPAIVAIAAALLVPSAAPARDAQPGIKILDGEANLLANFKSPKCSVGLDAGQRRFKARDTDGKWKLSVNANRFHGFNETYDIEWGIGDTNFIIKSPSGEHYANFYPPPNAPDFGGSLTFPAQGRKVMGLGFIAAYNGSNTDGVAVGGRATCHYPKRRH